MAREDTIAEIRSVLTDIKLLLKRDGSDELAIAIGAAETELRFVLAKLRTVQRNLHQWTPGPSETK